MIDRALTFLARLTVLLAPIKRRHDLIAIPVRRDDRRVRHDHRRG